MDDDLTESELISMKDSEIGMNFNSSIVSGIPLGYKGNHNSGMVGKDYMKFSNEKIKKK